MLEKHAAKAVRTWLYRAARSNVLPPVAELEAMGLPARAVRAIAGQGKLARRIVLEGEMATADKLNRELADSIATDYAEQMTEVAEDNPRDLADRIKGRAR